MSAHGFVGDVLVRAGVVDAGGITRALERQSERSISLGRALSELGLADEAAVASTIASALSLEYVDSDVPDVAESVTTLLPAEFCRKYRAVPIGLTDDVRTPALFDTRPSSELSAYRFRCDSSAMFGDE